MAKFNSKTAKEARKKAKPRGKGKFATVKEAVLDAFLTLQNDSKFNLVSWAKKNPSDFYKIAARLIPTEVVGAGGKDLFKAFNNVDTDKV